MATKRHAAIPITLTILCLFAKVRSSSLTYQGHWEKTWGEVSTTGFNAANYGFAFSGYVDVDEALAHSSHIYENLEGNKIFTIGGGNSNGRWTLLSLEKLNLSIQAGRLHSYDGIAYDIEEGDTGLTGAFLSSFEVAKTYGFFVVVTTTKTAPYGVDDADTLMSGVILSPHVDVISPMMYGSQQAFAQCEDGPGVIDYTEMRGIPWEWYSFSHAAIVPSLWRNSHYSYVQAFLGGKGVSTSGYIAWCPPWQG